MKQFKKDINLIHSLDSLKSLSLEYENLENIFNVQKSIPISISYLRFDAPFDLFIFCNVICMQLGCMDIMLL